MKVLNEVCVDHLGFVTPCFYSTKIIVNVFCLFFQLTERGYLNDQQSVTIEIEIFFSHLLFAPEYSPLDDIVRKQKQQIM